MVSPTRSFVVLGLIGCFSACHVAEQAPAAPQRFDPAPFFSADAAGCSQVFDRSGEPIALVGLTENVDPAHAPIPGNDSERLLFRQVYETLVQIGCDFTIRPGLASTWQLDATGASWNITLRPDARFSDGTAVTARDVIASWTRGGSMLVPEVLRFVRSATAQDEVTLSVTPRDDVRQDAASPPVPGFLAQPALAVARITPESRWPIGTRDGRLDGPEGTSTSGRPTITLVPTAAGGTLNTVGFLVSPRRDVRDLLDQGVDLLVTRDPAALAYAGTLAQFDVMPLPWLRSYIFVSRESAPGAALAPDVRQKVADDAVAGEAQGSSFDWPQAWGRCVASAATDAARNQSPRFAPASSGRIVFDAADPVARSLAERITVLTSARSAAGNLILDVLVPQSRSRRLQMEPLREPNLAAALNRGDEAGYVIALDRSAGCAAIASLLEQAPWMNGAVPLVDTRLRAVVRRGRAQLAMEPDGSLLIGRSPRPQ